VIIPKFSITDSIDMRVISFPPHSPPEDVNATPFLILGGLLAGLALYIMPAAILAWLREDKFSAAFTWEVVQSNLNLDYLVNWLIIGYLGGVVSSY
jgi:hypothetical protein